MGASGSSPAFTRHHSLLTKLSGLQGIDKDDVFYQHLLAGSPVSSAEPVAVQSFLEPYCEQLVVHNPMSHNFQALLLHSLQLMNDILSSTNTKQQPTTSMTSSSDSAADTARGMAALHALPFSMRFVGVLLQHVYDTGCSSSTLITLFQLNATQEQQLQQLQQQQSRRQFQQQQQQHAWGGGMDGGVSDIDPQRFHGRTDPHRQPSNPTVCGSSGQFESPLLLTAFLEGAMQVVARTAQSTHSHLPLCCLQLRAASGPSHILMHETLRMLLLATSTQMHSPSVRCPPGTHAVLEAVMGHTGGDSALQVVQALLHLFITRPAPPAQASIYSPSEAALSAAYKAMRYTTATLLWLPSKAASLLSTPAAPSGTSYSPVADSALLLLLVLTHCPEEPPTLMNPFRGVLRALSDPGYESQDAEGGLSHAAPSPRVGELASSTTTIHFRTLYAALGRGLVDEGGTLLLYSLLHGCDAFQDYVLSSTDPEVLLLPILRLLHRCLPGHTSHLYMLQILLLILSQDAAFCRNIHRIVLQPAQLSAVAEWLKEASLRAPVTLGSVTAVVLLRTVSAYFGGGGAPGEAKRDLGLPTNALAALANMAPHMEQMHSHAAYRLVSLFQSLSRRHSRLSNAAATTTATPFSPPQPPTSRISSSNRNSRHDDNAGSRNSNSNILSSTPSQPQSLSGAAARTASITPSLHPASASTGNAQQAISVGTESSAFGASAAGLPAAGSSSGTAAAAAAALLASQQQRAQQDAAAELPVVEDFLRIVLELINAILTTSLQNNQELLYALLQRQQLLSAYRQHPRLGELEENLQMLLQFFNRRLDEAKAPGVDGSKAKGPDVWDVARVQAVLAVATPFWRPDRMRTFPEMRFVYEQDGSSEEFFVPTIWALIVRNTASTLPWTLSNITLFQPQAALDAGASVAAPQTMR
ncbi:MAG: hypothetical protein WDW36_001389 [Sanguina aurantia]